MIPSVRSFTLSSFASLSCVVAACARTSPVAPPTVTPTQANVWSYEVDARSLDDVLIDATFSTGGAADAAIDPDVRPFVHDVVTVDGRRVRYALRLRAMAKKIAEADVAIATGDAVVATPAIWMMRPPSAPSDTRVRFHVTGTTFATGVDALKTGPAGTFELAVDDLDGASFTAFGPMTVETIALGAATVEVGVLPGEHVLDPAMVRKWVEADSRAVADYYGGYPVPHVLVLVMPIASGSTRGVTLGDGGPGLLVRLGKPLSMDTLADDWVVTHEMMHVAFPSLAREHAWLNEGLASYVEPFVRARAGLIDETRVWRDLLDGLPQANPVAGDEGLDKTHTWERTYWGGALFSLMADVTIRERTNNARSLDDALRAIQRKGGTVREHWKIERVLDEGDAATGTRVLHELYQSLALAPGKIDLPALYARLGVSLASTGVRFDDTAPLAAIRRSMTARPK